MIAGASFLLGVRGIVFAVVGALWLWRELKLWKGER